MKKRLLSISGLIGIVALSTPASSDSKSGVEAMLRKRFTEVGVRQMEDDPGDESRHRAASFRGAHNSGLWHRVGGTRKSVATSVVVGVDKGAAWFHTVGQVTLTSGKTVEKRAVRVSGIAVPHDGEWRIQNSLTTMTMDDKALLEIGAKPSEPLELPKSGPTLFGDKVTAKLVATWISNDGLTKAASASTTRVASGTAPNEYQTGANSAAMVAVWDKLDLVPAQVDVQIVKPTLAYATASIAWKAPKTTRSVHLKLAVVLVKEKDEWRWISLNWASAEWKPINAAFDEGEPGPDEMTPP